MVRILFLYLSFSILASNAFALEQVQNLSQAKRWSQLLHYRSSTWGQPESEITSPEFFLSSEGSSNLASELDATIKAMAEPIGVNPNLHAQCRFPARLIWLKKMAPEIASHWPIVDCPDFLKFAHQRKIESISFIFATGYLSNPASYFGHPLIKFNLPTEKMPSSLLDVSVNFGAITPPDENSFVYAAKGLFGGYKATFTHRQFYYNNHAYGEVELRDMWEYRLNLKPEEVEYFYSHVWEVIGKKFPYYFISENCATAAARLLEDVVGIKSSSLPYSLPYTFFDHLAGAKRADGESLVTAVKLIPSRQSRLTAHYRQLDENQKGAVHRIVNGESVTETLKSLPPEKRALAVETLFDYYSFRSLQDRKEGSINETVANTKRELLLERLKLPASVGPDLADYNLHPPAEGPRPFLLRLGPAQSLKFDSGMEFQFRIAYYDFLSLDSGRPKNSEVRVMDATLVSFDKAVWLRKLDLIAVTTLNISQTGLPGDGGLAWRFSTGFEKLNLSCRDCDLFKIEAGFGKAYTLLDQFTVFTMLDVRGQTPTAGSGLLAATPTVGALVDWFSSGVLKTEFSAGYRGYLERDDANSEILKIDNRLGLSRGWDIRAAYEKHVDEWYRLGVSLYL